MLFRVKSGLIQTFQGVAVCQFHFRSDYLKTIHFPEIFSGVHGHTFKPINILLYLPVILLFQEDRGRGEKKQFPPPVGEKNSLSKAVSLLLS